MATPTGRRPSLGASPLDGGFAARATDGDLVAGRYRLRRRVADNERTSTWEAVDETLARPVAVTVMPLERDDDPAARAFLDAAAEASGLASPTLVRVYDAAAGELPSGRVAYVVSEWVTGHSLDAVLSDGPMPIPQAVALATTLAEAASVAHAAGLVHGRIHAGNVLLDRSGRVRLTDVGIAAAARGVAQPGRTPDPEDVARDTRDIAACLFAALTGSWPSRRTPQPAGRLPVAEDPRGTRAEQRTGSPRRLRSEVPRDLDAVVRRALAPEHAGDEGPLTTPGDLAGALARLGRGPRPGSARSRSSEPRAPGMLRKNVPRVAAAALLVAVGVAGYTTGQKVGAVPAPDDGLQGQTLDAPASAGDEGTSASGPIDLEEDGVTVRAYDPLGDGAEQGGSVPNAYDRDPSTSWTTDTYRSAAFGGLKPGVGLVVDLGRPATVERVDLAMANAGGQVELRVGNRLTDEPSALRTVASEAGGKRVRLTSPPGTTGRYWLVWFTELPPAGSGFRAEVQELLLVGR